MYGLELMGSWPTIGSGTGTSSGMENLMGNICSEFRNVKREIRISAFIIDLMFSEMYIFFFSF